MKDVSRDRLPIFGLLALTAAALLVHGYHSGVEDAEIYVPAAKKLLHPDSISLCPRVLPCARPPFHLRADPGLDIEADQPLDGLDAVCLVCRLPLRHSRLHCWMILVACFSNERARWTSMLIVTAVLTMPATNTGLLLVDPYLTARSFSVPVTLFALAGLLQRRYGRVAAAMFVAGAVHPQMIAYLLFLAGVMWVTDRRNAGIREPVPVLASAIGLLPTGFHLSSATGPYREALYSRDYFFLYNWTWYHWLGMLAPLAILAWFWRGNLRGTESGFQRISFALIPLG